MAVPLARKRPDPHELDEPLVVPEAGEPALDVAKQAAESGPGDGVEEIRMPLAHLRHENPNVGRRPRRALQAVRRAVASGGGEEEQERADGAKHHRA